MRNALRQCGLRIEPGGAAAMAAVLSGSLPDNIQTIAVTLSGGNVDAEILQLALDTD